MIKRTVTVQTTKMRPTANDVSAAINAFTAEIANEGKAVDGEVKAVVKTHVVGQSMTFECSANLKKTDESAAKKPNG